MPSQISSASVRSRSWLFTPATRPDRFEKGSVAGADVVILDLEDAVAPGDKDVARQTAIAFLEGGASGGARRALRINALSTPAGVADLAALLASAAEPDVLILPKTEAAAEVGLVSRMLSAAGKAAKLVALIESARGIASAETIATAAPGRLEGLMLGAADMAADLGAETGWEPLGYARGRIVAAAALSGVLPIDAPHFQIHDDAGLAHETALAVAFGFRAKAAIHPAQIKAINDALSPSAEQVDEARAVLAANGKGVGTVGGRMVDEAVARKARRVLAAAGAAA